MGVAPEQLVARLGGMDLDHLERLLVRNLSERSKQYSGTFARYATPNGHCLVTGSLVNDHGDGAVQSHRPNNSLERTGDSAAGATEGYVGGD